MTKFTIVSPRPPAAFSAGTNGFSPEYKTTILQFFRHVKKLHRKDPHSPGTAGFLIVPVCPKKADPCHFLLSLLLSESFIRSIMYYFIFAFLLIPAFCSFLSRLFFFFFCSPFGILTVALEAVFLNAVLWIVVKFLLFIVIVFNFPH